MCACWLIYIYVCGVFVDVVVARSIEMDVR
jgi:hypothetical protein